MMYQEKMVCTIKVDGKVLREQNGTVFLPFNSTFTILLKNLNSRRAKVNITIDDEDILNGDSLVVNANSDLELKRFLTENDEKGPRFKFVEKTDEIREGRGENNGMDGIVKITFQYEIQNVVGIETYRCPTIPEYLPCEDGVFGWPTTTEPILYGAKTSDAIGAGQNERRFDPNNPRLLTGDQLFNTSLFDGSAGLNQVNCFITQPELKNDDGMTIKGEEIKQEFTTVSSLICEHQQHVICLQLKGNVNQTIINKPITVKTQKVCEKCTKSNKWNANFCDRCGNNLKQY